MEKTINLCSFIFWRYTNIVLKNWNLIKKIKRKIYIYYVLGENKIKEVEMIFAKYRFRNKNKNIIIRLISFFFKLFHLGSNINEHNKKYIF
jgi:hypothetical protein